MTETRSVLACAECQAHWYVGHEPAKCTDPDHTHRRFDVHRHRAAVVLPDGSTVTAVSFDAADPYTRDQQPDYGLYLDRRWQPPWTHDHLDWPDFGVPDDSAPSRGCFEIRARPGSRRGTGGSRLHRWPRTHRNDLGLPRYPGRPSAWRGGRLGPGELLRRSGRDPGTEGVHCRTCRLTPQHHLAPRNLAKLRPRV
jgi:hypothetical protein